MLAGVVCGSRLPEGWAQGRDTVDFFDVKADVEAVLGFAGALDAFTFVPGKHQRCTRVKPRASSVRASGRLCRRDPP
jgi:phenylalanyl-tRNA synthetase beta subunit